MVSHEYRVLSYSQIFLDPENPRHDLVDSQRELILAMIDDQGEKLVALAHDIIKYGTNPSDLPIVIPSDPDKEKFIVAEGNRRITTLKLLHNPTLCAKTKLSRQFVELSKIFLKNPVQEIGCIVYPERSATRHWVKLKHTGENKGAGTVGWDATVKQRFDAMQSKPSIGLQMINFFLGLDDLGPEIKKLFKEMNISTVKRLVGDPKVRTFLGLDHNEGQLYSELCMEDAARVAEEFFLPFATGEKKVTAVYHKTDREEYLKGLDSSRSAEYCHPVKEKWPLHSPPKIDENTARAAKKTIQTRSQPLARNRKYLIPRDCIIKISHIRINGIYRELREELSVKAAPNAVAVLLRVFLENSLDIFIEKKNIGSHENDKLHQKVTKVTDYLQENNVLKSAELKPVRKAVSSPHSLFSTNTLNAYVHNPSIQPKPTELNDTWSEMELFMKKLWE